MSKPWIQYVGDERPGRRWWVVRRTAQGTGSIEGAIKVSAWFPDGSVYPTRKKAEAALRRWLKDSL